MMLLQVLEKTLFKGFFLQIFSEIGSGDKGITQLVVVFRYFMAE